MLIRDSIPRTSQAPSNMSQARMSNAMADHFDMLLASSHITCAQSGYGYEEPFRTNYCGDGCI